MLLLYRKRWASVKWLPFPEAHFAGENYIKKAGNARSKLLAYRSFSRIQTMQNGKIVFALFPIV